MFLHLLLSFLLAAGMLAIGTIPFIIVIGGLWAYDAVRYIIRLMKLQHLRAHRPV